MGNVGECISLFNPERNVAFALHIFSMLSILGQEVPPFVSEDLDEGMGTQADQPAGPSHQVGTSEGWSWTIWNPDGAATAASASNPAPPHASNAFAATAAQATIPVAPHLARPGNAFKAVAAQATTPITPRPNNASAATNAQASTPVAPRPNNAAEATTGTVLL